MVTKEAGEALAYHRYARMGGGQLQNTGGPDRVPHEQVLTAAESMLARGSDSFAKHRVEDALMQLWCFVTFLAYGLQALPTRRDLVQGS